VQVYVGRDDDGLARYESRTVRAPNTAAGKRKALQVAGSFFDEVRARSGPPGSVAEHIEAWLTHRSPDWAPGEAERNRRMLADRVLPTLGAIPLDRLSTIDIDRCYSKLWRRGLSAGSIRRTHGFLRSALQQAVKWRKLERNPAATATIPGLRPVAPTRLPEAATIRAVIGAASTGFGVLVRLAVHTGARTGELVALRWHDIDLDDRVARIWQSKTGKWKVLALGAATAAVLTGWRKLVAEQYELAHDRAMPGDWWVFPSPRNPTSAIAATSVSHAWARLRDDAGLSGVPFKALRKTMSTVLLTAGHDLRTVMGRGGWSAAAAAPGDASVLLVHYAQFVTGADRLAAEALDDWVDAAGDAD
jgi:integrase